MIATVARVVIPSGIRTRLGCWAMMKAAHRESWFKWYMAAAHGYATDNLSLLPDNEADYRHNGYSIVFPRDGIGSAFEVFSESIYDRVNPVHAGDVVVDVGAYVGMFTLKVAPIARQVIAIEPNRQNVNYLIRNIVKNKVKNVHTVAQAASNATGEGYLYLSTMSSCHSLVYSGRGVTKVLRNTLDNLCGGIDRIGFVKIDAEGAELQVIQGGKDALMRTRSVVVAVYHTKEGNDGVEAVARELSELGFVIEMRKGLRSYIYGTRYSWMA